MKRLLRPSDIPESIWEPESEVVNLPEALRNAYAELLAKYNLLQVARTQSEFKGEKGGRDKKSTEYHFATKFQNSSGRVLLTATDPKGSLQNASDLTLRAFAGGEVGLLDIPSGSGAATVALLTTIAELRENHIVPSEPLTVHVVFGDASSHALEIARELLTLVQGDLKRQAIFVRAQYVEWDVTNAEETTAIIHEWVTHARDCRRYFVLMANFSGFLGASGKFKQAKPQLGEIFRWASQRSSTIVWLEPKVNEATNTLFPKVIEWLSKVTPSVFVLLWHRSKVKLFASCKLRDSILETTPWIHVCLLRLEPKK